MRLIHLYVALGGGAGAAARFWLSAATQGLPGTALPWGTLIANVTGSALLGALLAAFERTSWSPELRAGSTIGVCGGFTTFSAFSHEAVRMVVDARYSLAAAYVLGSTALCVGGFFVGMVALRR